MVRIFSLPPCTLLIQDKVDSMVRSKGAADRVIYYIRLSSEQPVGRWRSFLIIVRAVWDAVKSLFGHSAWQRAIRDIEKELYRDWNKEVGSVDRDLLHLTAQNLLDQLVKDNVDGKEYVEEHMALRHQEQLETKKAFLEEREFWLKPIECLGGSKEPADTIQHCLNRYMPKRLHESEEFLVIAAKDIWNVVKWMFGYSAWQLAVDAIENQVYYHWKTEQGCVDRTMLRNTAEQFLKKLVEKSRSGKMMIDDVKQNEMKDKYENVEYSLYTKKKKNEKRDDDWDLDSSFNNLMDKYTSPKKFNPNKN